MITVLQIIPNMGAGGAEQACVDVAKGLLTRGDRAMVVTRGGARLGELTDLGADVLIRDVATKNPAKILANALWLARLVKKEGIDLLHVRSRAPGWSVWIAARLAHVPFVATFHAAYKYNNRLKKAYNRVMARADRVIAISQYIADHLRDHYGLGPDRIRLVRRGIDLWGFTRQTIDEERRVQLRRLWSIAPETRVILCPARLSPIKGQALFLDAMALLPPSCGDIVGVIVGDDQGRKNYRADLERKRRDLKLDGRVRMVPHCADMPAAYSLAHLVVVPSKVPEGFGRVPVEAMAMGVPVIASDLGATRETVMMGQTGWLLPPDSPQLWADAITRAFAMRDDERDIMARRARERAEGQFNHMLMVDETLAVYDELTVAKGA